MMSMGRWMVFASVLALGDVAWAEGPSAWLTTAVDADRFADREGFGPALEQGDEVEVVLRDGERVRVRSGNDFGWVPASALSDVPPTPGELDLSGVLDSLKGAGE